MLELIQEIRTHTEAGSILEHMELFDILETNAKALEAIKIKRAYESAMNVVFDDGTIANYTTVFRDNIDKMRKD